MTEAETRTEEVKVTLKYVPRIKDYYFLGYIDDSVVKFGLFGFRKKDFSIYGPGTTYDSNPWEGIADINTTEEAYALAQVLSLAYSMGKDDARKELRYKLGL